MSKVETVFSEVIYIILIYFEIVKPVDEMSQDESSKHPTPTDPLKPPFQINLTKKEMLPIEPVKVSNETMEILKLPVWVVFSITLF